MSTSYSYFLAFPLCSPVFPAKNTVFPAFSQRGHPKTQSFSRFSAKGCRKPSRQGESSLGRLPEDYVSGTSSNYRAVRGGPPVQASGHPLSSLRWPTRRAMSADISFETHFQAQFGDARANVALCCHQPFAKGRQLWGDSPEFHGAAFLLHHQRAHLVSAAQVGVVSNAAAVAKSPAEFLKWVIEAQLCILCLGFRQSLSSRLIAQFQLDSFVCVFQNGCLPDVLAVVRGLRIGLTLSQCSGTFRGLGFSMEVFWVSKLGAKSLCPIPSRATGVLGAAQERRIATAGGGWDCASRGMGFCLGHLPNIFLRPFSSTFGRTFGSNLGRRNSACRRKV